MFTAVYAGDDSTDAHIANTILILLKEIHKSWVNTNDYQHASFVHKGMQVTGFKCKTSNWIGFYKKISSDNLPSNALLQLNDHYRKYCIGSTVMYFSTDGKILYFTEIKRNKKSIILKVGSSGEMSVFSCTQRK